MHVNERERKEVGDGILGRIGGTPLVRLCHLGRELPAPIYVKCEHLNPGGSVKDRIALAIVDDAQARGVLTPGMTIVEATAGNTGIGLALVAAARGYSLVCVMAEKMSRDKRAALAAVGAEVIVVANAPPSDPNNFCRVAEKLAAENGWFLADQFNNLANIRVHEATTGPEIVADLGDAPAAFVAAVGTGGTLCGVARHLKRIRPDTLVVLADPVGSALAGWIKTGHFGADTSYLLEGIGGSEAPGNLDRAVIDEAVSISDAEAFETTRLLIQREGLLVGGSAGANVAAALRIAARPGLRGAVVTVLPDAWDRYRSTPWMQAFSG